jgi:PKD repeat protein
MKKALLVFLLLPLLAGCTISLPGEKPVPPLPGPIEPVNSPPIALFSISHRIPYTEQQVIFDANASRDYDGWIVAYRWDLGPAGVQTAPVVAVTYHSSGDYPISLTVTDNEGASATREHLLTVQAVDPCNGGGCSGGTCH